MSAQVALNVNLRHPAAHEVEPLLALFEADVRAGLMLPRSPESVRCCLESWLVAEVGGEVIGCVSLVRYNDALCEVRSLAVRPDFRGQGIASRLVRAALGLAREQGYRRVLTLTRAPRLFEKVGFRLDVVTNFPEKVWEDCAPCPFKDACDEVALVYHLEDEA